MAIQINQLFQNIENIPRVPEIVRTLVNQVNNPDIDFTLVADNIEKEQVIAVKVLKLVNSAHYSLPRKVGSIRQALVILGMQELKSLVIASGFINSVEEVPGLNLDDFWIDNFRTARYAQWLADATIKEHSDMIFTAGLIASLGKILIYLSAPEQAINIAREVKLGTPLMDAQLQHLGFTHQDISAELGRQWQFSPELVETIEQSAAPLEHSEVSLAACVVKVAKYVSQSTYSEKEDEEILADFPHKEWQQLGLKNNDIEQKMAIMMELDTGIEGLLD